MIVEVHNKLGRPQRLEISRAVVYDVCNNPLAFILEHSPGHYTLMQRGEKGFRQALQALGILDTTVTDVIGPEQHATPPGQLILPPGD
jgi:hypothetical protein